MRSGRVENMLRTMDSCRIRGGRVTPRVGHTRSVDAVPLILVDGTLTFGEPREEQVAGWRDGHDFIPDAWTGREPGIVNNTL